MYVDLFSVPGIFKRFGIIERYKLVGVIYLRNNTRKKIETENSDETQSGVVW